MSAMRGSIATSSCMLQKYPTLANSDRMGAQAFLIASPAHKHRSNKRQVIERAALTVCCEFILRQRAHCRVHCFTDPILHCTHGGHVAAGGVLPFPLRRGMRMRESTTPVYMCNPSAPPPGWRGAHTCMQVHLHKRTHMQVHLHTRAHIVHQAGVCWMTLLCLMPK